MSRTRVHPDVPIRAAMVAWTVVSTACAPMGPAQPPSAAPAPSEPASSSEPAPSTGAVSGAVRFTTGQPVDTTLGPVVVLLEPIDPAAAPARPTQLFRITSRTDRFDPGFTTIGAGDFIVFVNAGGVSHRFFSAALGSEVQIPVSPADSSAPQRIERTGELRFFCSLHPDENFSVLVTANAFSAVVDADRSFYVAPIPDGSYRLSVWSRRGQVAIRTVQVTGQSIAETIVLDPSQLR